jgi:hypothetical protein
VDLANLGSESETCVERCVRLVGVSISFEKKFYRLPSTPPSLVRRIGPLEVFRFSPSDGCPATATMLSRDASLAIPTRALRFEASRRQRLGRSDRPLGG